MPLFKFGALFIRTLSKPVAAAIKKRAVEHENFRSRCAAFAQWWHRMEVRLQVQLMGHTARTIRPLGEAEAVKSGAEILGEGVIFSIAAAVMLAENRRAAASDARKKAQIQEEFSRQNARLEELEEAVASLRSDTIEIMKAGGKYTKEQILSRVRGEAERRKELEELTKQVEEESWLQSLSRWAGLGSRVASGDKEALEEASKAAVAAVSPSVVSK
eukprot:CAMPEP_0173396676 /NCGR_PEP_ID=MMETSP1356-20130122/36203_1 /TAXON_ID=77927 ORGANISM="Hemiselmis virescens, Strain PCC157" /NCGR_SAMPLE_ID=MMETSP1356 /ASSEMBLY_ACC=CAM_ASM_000847 /LENGTH=215 /DNA_ID=CAMNT_0014355761 /DNA_START=269 /DNA_END=913 /DNA_ORIENTATION=+